MFKKKTKLAVIIPCYNEELVIKTTVETLLRVLDDLIEKGKISSDSYLYLVDDGSKDKTWSIIEELHSKTSRVKGTKFVRNYGNQKALIAGLLGVKEFGCDCALTIDADLQQDENSIEKFIDDALAVFGAEKEIKIDHLESCSECKGTGAKPGSKPVICPTCHGTGQVQQVTQTILGSFTQVTVCPKCSGKGQVIESPCPKCKGEGRIEAEKTVKVKIPAGIDDNSKMRIAHEGDAGLNGGSTGDLYVVLHVRPHKTFKRDGFNIYTEEYISVPQAVLGDSVEVNTVHGQKVLNIPAGTEYGKMITIKGAGVPVLGSNDKCGDHIVLIKYRTPKSLNEEEKRLYKRLFEISTNRKSNDNIINKFKNAIHS